MQINWFRSLILELPLPLHCYRMGVYRSTTKQKDDVRIKYDRSTLYKLINILYRETTAIAYVQRVIHNLVLLTRIELLLPLPLSC